MMLLRRKRERVCRELMAPGPNLDPLYMRQLESFNKRADILSQCKNVYDTAAQSRGVNMHDVRSMTLLRFYTSFLMQMVLPSETREFNMATHSKIVIPPTSREQIKNMGPLLEVSKMDEAS